jgi:predicted transposase YbfD/YdcC
LVGFSEFPHLEQAFRIERVVTKLDGSRLREHEVEICFGFTSLSKKKADAARLLDLNRGHWSIENKVHYVRDRTFDEDRSQIRKKNAPQTMACLRNLAISVLRLAGAGNGQIPAALRLCSRRVRAPLRLLGLP